MHSFSVPLGMGVGVVGIGGGGGGGGHTVLLIVDFTVPYYMQSC